MKRWVKWIIIIAVILVSSIFFGSMVFTMLGSVLDAMSWVMSFLADALRWLGRVFDVFGILGVFGASADATLVQQNAQIVKQFLIK